MIRLTHGFYILEIKLEAINFGCGTSSVEEDDPTRIHIRGLRGQPKKPKNPKTSFDSSHEEK